MEPRRDTRAAVLAGFLGWTLDAFDFFLVVMCLTAIAAEFGRPDKDVAFTLTMTLAFDRWAPSSLACSRTATGAGCR